MSIIDKNESIKKESRKKESMKKLGYLSLIIGIYKIAAKKFKNIKKLILFEIVFQIAVILIAIATVVIACMVFYTANKQFDETLKSGRPILAVNTYRFTPFIYKDKIRFECLLKVKNFGDRPATEIEINLYSILFERANNKFTIIDKFQDKSANLLANGVTWDLRRKFTAIKDNNEIIIYLDVVYKDLILEEEMEFKSYYLIPKSKNLKSNTKYRLLHLSYDDKIILEENISELLE